MLEKMPSTLEAIRIADVLEGRATIEMVEPLLQDDVSEAIAAYRQGRDVPVIDTLDEQPPAESSAAPVSTVTPEPEKEAPADGPTPAPAA